MAAPPNTSTVTAAGSSGHASLCVNGRISSVHPKGVAHNIHRVLEPESAIMRTTKATPTQPIPSPVATRRVRPSCDVSAPNAPNTAGAMVMLDP